MHTASVVLFDYRCRFSSISCALFFCAALVPVCVCVCRDADALPCIASIVMQTMHGIERFSANSARNLCTVFVRRVGAFNCLKCKLSVANSRRRRALLNNSDGFAEQTCFFFVVVSLTLVWKACRYLQWSLIFIFQQHVNIICWYDVHRIRKASTRVVLLLLLLLVLLFCVSQN